MTRNQLGTAKARSALMREQAKVRSAQMKQQARIRSALLREQAIQSGPGRTARRTAAQVAPFAIGASLAARKGIRVARIWAAPRIEHAGHSLEDEVAPKVASMLVTAARAIEPEPARRRLRWPLFTAGVAVLAGGGAAAAYRLTRRTHTVGLSPSGVVNGSMPTAAPERQDTSPADASPNE